MCLNMWILSFKWKLGKELGLGIGQGFGLMLGSRLNQPQATVNLRFTSF